MQTDEIRIRLKHAWVAVATFRMSQQEAEQYTSQGHVKLEDLDPMGVQAPICYVCEKAFEEAPWACAGEPD